MVSYSCTRVNVMLAFALKCQKLDSAISRECQKLEPSHSKQYSFSYFMNSCFSRVYRLLSDFLKQFMFLNLNSLMPSTCQHNEQHGSILRVACQQHAQIVCNMADYFRRHSHLTLRFTDLSVRNLFVSFSGLCSIFLVHGEKTKYA